MALWNDSVAQPFVLVTVSTGGSLHPIANVCSQADRPHDQCVDWPVALQVEEDQHGRIPSGVLRLRQWSEANCTKSKRTGVSGVYVRPLPACLPLVVRKALMFEEVGQPGEAAWWQLCVWRDSVSLVSLTRLLAFCYAATANVAELLSYRQNQFHLKKQEQNKPWSYFHSQWVQEKAAVWFELK